MDLSQHFKFVRATHCTPFIKATPFVKRPGTSAEPDPGQKQQRKATRHMQMTLLARTLLLTVLFASACTPTSRRNFGDIDEIADIDAFIDIADAIDTDDLEITPEVCELLPTADTPPFLERLGCERDFDRLASRPLDVSIPQARSVKTVYDRIDGRLYFQDSTLYPTHHAFCTAHLSGSGRPPVPPLSQFNQTEYYSPNRRFILGALTRYTTSNGALWVFELSPYDTASLALIETAFAAIDAHTPFPLAFHPTSTALESRVSSASFQIVTTDTLFEDIAYQPLNLGTGVGRLRFIRAKDLPTTSLDFRDIPVLDLVPNDLPIVAALITESPQTPLAHVNVLSQNRGTPNMSLRGAFSSDLLRPFEDRLVKLEVGPFDWHIAEISNADAEAFWQQHRPPPLGLPAIDLETTAVIEIRDVTRLPTPEEGRDLGPALSEAIAAYGGKASHYSALTHIPDLPVPPAFAIPISWYHTHLETHGLDALIAPLPSLSPAALEEALADLRAKIIAAPLDPALYTAFLERLAFLPTERVRVRSSTNAEDLDGFTGAGLYTSMTADPTDPDRPIELAIKTVWASVWGPRAFHERAYRGIDHRNVGMALLVSPAFPSEEANGVAITGNLFDPTGAEPGFVVNVQRGDISVVLPPPGVTSDYFLYHYAYPNQPMVFLSHSNLIAPGQTVLTTAQARALGDALDKIHTHFAKTYAKPGKFYGMDIEFKFDGPPLSPPALVIKQARPHPGWGLTP